MITILLVSYVNQLQIDLVVYFWLITKHHLLEPLQWLVTTTMLIYVTVKLRVIDSGTDALINWQSRPWSFWRRDSNHPRSETEAPINADFHFFWRNPVFCIFICVHFCFHVTTVKRWFYHVRSRSLHFCSPWHCFDLFRFDNVFCQFFCLIGRYCHGIAWYVRPSAVVVACMPFECLGAWSRRCRLITLWPIR